MCVAEKNHATKPAKEKRKKTVVKNVP